VRFNPARWCRHLCETTRSSAPKTDLSAVLSEVAFGEGAGLGEGGKRESIHGYTDALRHSPPYSHPLLALPAMPAFSFPALTAFPTAPRRSI
jgi:hypothetical protein